jgi:hypothetical protein
MYLHVEYGILTGYFREKKVGKRKNKKDLHKKKTAFRQSSHFQYNSITLKS